MTCSFRTWAVLSPSTGGFDRAGKMPVYAREAAKHLWLVNPLERTLDVFRLIEGRWTLLSTHEGDALLRAEPFEAVVNYWCRRWPETKLLILRE